MKFKGEAIQPPKPIDIVLPKRDGDGFYVFKAQAILSFDEFDKAVPEPKVPMITKRGSSKPVPDEKDERYLKELGTYIDKRLGWMYLKALEPTTDLEFSKMSLSDPSTWSHDTFIKEFTDAGFSAVEINHVLKNIKRASAFDEKHIEEARERFLQETLQASNE